MHVAWPKRPVEQGPQRRDRLLGRFRGRPGQRGEQRIVRRGRFEHADVSAGPGNPRHVIQADVGIRLLRESLDEQELVKVQARVAEYQAADYPASVEIQRAPRLFRRIGGHVFEPLLGFVDLAKMRGHIDALRPQRSGKATRTLDMPRGRVLRRAGNLDRRPRAQAALVRLFAERKVRGGCACAIDFDFVQVKEEGLRARNRDPYVPGRYPLRTQHDFERGGAAHAAEMLSLIVMEQRPGLAVERAEHLQAVGVVQARRVIQAVVDHDAAGLDGPAQVHLPPRICLQTHMKTVCSVLDPVAAARRVGCGGKGRPDAEQPIGLDLFPHDTRRHRLDSRNGERRHWRQRLLFRGEDRERDKQRGQGPTAPAPPAITI